MNSGPFFDITSKFYDLVIFLSNFWVYIIQQAIFIAQYADKLLCKEKAYPKFRASSEQVVIYILKREGMHMSFKNHLVKIINFFSFKTIRSKLLTAFITTVIPVILLGIVSFNIAADALQRKASEAANDTLKQASNYLELMFTNIDNLSIQINTNADLQSYLSFSGTSTYEKYERQKKASTYAIHASSIYKFISDINIVLKDTNSIMSPNYDANNVDYNALLEDPFSKKIMDMDGRIIFSGKHEYLDSLTRFSEYAITGARTIKLLNTGVVAGIIFVDVKLDNIQSILNELAEGNRGEYHLISPDGRVISSKTELSGNTAEGSAGNQEASGAQESGASEETSLYDMDFIKNIHVSDNEQGSEFVDYKNEKYLMAYTYIGSTGYVLVSLIPNRILMEASSSIQQWTLILVFLGMAFAIGVGLYMSMSMGRTINRTINNAKKAASGDLSVEFTSRRKDELGLLAKSINTMISNTRKLIADTIEVSHNVSESASMISGTTQRISEVSREITGAIQEIAKGAIEQASYAEEGVNKMDQLASRINNVTDAAGKIEDLSMKTMVLTRNGLDSVEELENKTKETTSNTKAIFSDINALETHSQSIGKIIGVINSIADQTNLLALNAAIEAARAGESGRGFAVVAGEIRKLAEQSMAATRDISAIIKSTQQQTEITVRRSLETEEILKSQNEAVINTIEAFKSIASSMEELAKCVQDIKDGTGEMNSCKGEALISIQNISAVSEETAASSQEVNASTEEQLASIENLANLALEFGEVVKKMNESISVFKLTSN